MLLALHPTYTFEIVVHDRAVVPPLGGIQAYQIGPGNIVPSSLHKFGYVEGGNTGCDEALSAIKKAIADVGIVADVRLTKFEHSA